MIYKKCDTQWKEFDVYGHMPVRLYLHMLVCRECRAEYRRLRKLLKKTSGKSPYTTEKSAQLILGRLRDRKYSLSNNPVSDVTWLLCGVVLVLGGVIFPYLGGYMWARVMLGIRYEVVTFMIFGILISVYTVLFVISHYRLFMHYFNKGNHTDTIIHQ